METNEWRDSLGAQWLFLTDPQRKIQKDLEGRLRARLYALVDRHLSPDTVFALSPTRARRGCIHCAASGLADGPNGSMGVMYLTPRLSVAGIMPTVLTGPAVAASRTSTATDPVRVGIVHGSRLIGEGLRDLLSHESSLDVVAVFPGIDAATRDPVGGTHVLLTDLTSLRRAGMSGLRALLSAAPAGKVLVFDVEDDDAAIVECVRAGAAGCVLRDASLTELVAAIASVATGSAPLSPRIITSLFRYVADQAEGRETSISDLTPREEEILQLLSEGLSNKEIAGRLFLQPQTVKNYVHLVFQKLDVHSRLDVIRLLRSRRR